MPKPWSEIRLRALSLHRKGETLEQIRSIIKDETGFDASVRAYRMRFKEWKIRRRDQANNSNEGSRGLDIDVLTAGRTNATGDQAPLSEVPAAGEPRPLTKSPVELVKADRSQSRTTSSPKPVTHVLDLYAFICRRMQYRYLESCPFKDRQTTILHFAVAEAASDRLVVHSVQEIAKFMQDKQISFDMRDGHGRTALSLAIRTNQQQIVQGLLDRGASATALTDNNTTPLHVAADCRACPNIHRALITHGADKNALSSDRSSSSSTPLYIVLNQLSTQDVDSSDVIKACAILDCYVAPDTVFENDLRGVLRRALETFLAAWHSTRGLPSLLKSCSGFLRALLRGGEDPTYGLERARAGNSCCTSLATMSFFHSPNSDLATLVIRESLETYRSSLAALLLTGCAASTCVMPSSFRLLEELLGTSKSSPLSWSACTDILEYSKPFMQIGHLQTLFSDEDREIDWSLGNRPSNLQIASALVKLDTTVFCSVFEIMLGGDWPWKRGPWSKHDTKLDTLCLSLRSKINDTAWQPEDFDPSIEAMEYEVQSYLYPDTSYATTTDWQLNRRFLSGLLHVVTKEGISVAGPGTARKAIRLKQILELRKRFDLPSLTIDLELLLGAFENAGA